MLITFFRAIIIYILVLIVMRVMGKREIGQLQPFELVIAVMIADLASTPMSDIGSSLFDGIVPILALFVMHLLISSINLRSVNIRKIISGKPSILVYRGKIDEKVLKKEKITINELQERLRGNNIFSMVDVEYAILETSGQLTVIPKPEKRGTIPQDFGIVPEYDGLSYDLIVDGKVMYENLKQLGKDIRWLEKEAQNSKANPNNILLMTIDGKGEIFCQKKEQK